MAEQRLADRLTEIQDQHNELDDIYYDEDDPLAFDGDCVIQLHDLCDKAISLSIDAINAAKQAQRRNSTTMYYVKVVGTKRKYLIAGESRRAALACAKEREEQRQQNHPEDTDKHAIEIMPVDLEDQGAAIIVATK